MGNDPVDLSLEFCHETDGAVCVSDGDDEVLLPKSQIIEGMEEIEVASRGDMVYLTIPSWLAQDRGLI